MGWWVVWFSLPDGPPSGGLVGTTNPAAKELETIIKRVSHLISIAKKPVIYAGQGIIDRAEGPVLPKNLVDMAQIPVTVDELDPRSLHMLGRHGSTYANMAIQEVDLIITLGARLDDRVTGDVANFTPAARAPAAGGRGGIVHFEIIPKNINKAAQATEAVGGGVQTT